VPDDAVIVAHSFGVVVTIEFLLHWPQRAAGMVLSSWVALQQQEGHRMHWCVSHNWTRCRMYKSSLQEPWRDKMIAPIAQGKFMWGPDGDGIGGALQNWDVRKKLHLLTGIPSLCFGGEFDIVFPEDVKEMCRALKGEYAYLSDAGHFSFVDRKDRWLSTFKQWLTNIGLASRRSHGCGRANSLILGEPVAQLVGHRRYFLTLPSSYSSDHSHSLVVSFHGAAGQPEDAPFFHEFVQSADGVIFAFPEGLGDSSAGTSVRTWNGAGSVGSPGPAGPTCDAKKLLKPHPCFDSCKAIGGCRDACWLTTCADDVGFVQSLLDDIESRFCVNISSVNAVGFSNGGCFMYELGTNLRVAQRFQSVVAISGLPFRGFNRLPEMLPGARFLGIWGHTDTLVPAFGNRPGKPDEALSETGWIFSTWENTTQLWARELGCREKLRNSSSLRVPEHSPVRCKDYDGCYGSAVSVCFWNGPHAVPPGALQVAWQVFFGMDRPFPRAQTTAGPASLTTGRWPLAPGRWIPWGGAMLVAGLVTLVAVRGTARRYCSNQAHEYQEVLLSS